VFRTNLEAAQVIPRQLRLRNLGGIIVIDFIDMEDEEHRRQVLRTLEKACEAIRPHPHRRLLVPGAGADEPQAHPRVAGPAGLRALRGVRGLGVVKTPQSTCIEVFRAMLQDATARCARSQGPDHEPGEYLIRANEAVVDRLLDEDAGSSPPVPRRRRSVRIQVEPSYGPGEFDIVLVQPMRRPG
jgi:ribonuclease G